MAKKAGFDIKQEKSSGIFSKFRWGESYTSLFLGLVIVVIAVVVVLSLGRNRQTKQTSSVQDSATNREEKKEEAKKDKTQKIYVVKKGDNLWSISEEIYKSGYNWVDIALANKLANPDQIFSGNKLIIPEVKMKAPETKKKEVKTNAIKGSSYKIIKGDNLWDIAVRAYGDGYRWVEIAKANKLTNPDLIFSENILKIPR